MKALVSTIEPIDGGVPSMLNWVCKNLAGLNIEPVIAWYSPWRNQPNLSVPFYRLGTRVPRILSQTVFQQYNGYGIGAWLPELEFTHYLPTTSWRELIRSCHLHLAVSGNSMAATPFVLENIPFLAWIATPWEADRKNRIAAYSFQRKLIDYSITRPVTRKLERKILRSHYGSYLTLSSYTARELKKVSGRTIDDTMLLPVDRSVYFSNSLKTISWRIGFSGRYCDPRKNTKLLLEAIQILVRKQTEIELILVGDKRPADLLVEISKYQLEDRVKCYSHMDSYGLSELLQTFDVFVIPSHQEGLCISALEAMACGVPVVSTYCGGPEEFVIPGRTGTLVRSTPEDLAYAIYNICKNRDTRRKLSEGSLDWIIANATEDQSSKVFRRYLFKLGQRRGLQSHFSEDQYLNN